MSELPPPVRQFLDAAAGALTVTSTSAPAEAGRYDRVLVAVADRAALRRLLLPAGLRSGFVGVYVAAASAPLALVPKPEWPGLLGLHARPAGDGWFTTLRFERRAEVADVVREAGRQSVWSEVAGGRGLRVSPLDVVSEKVPADVLLPGAPDPAEPSEVTGRTPVTLREVPGPVSLGPLDERVLNPIGFDPRAAGPVVALSSLDLRDGPTEALVASLRPAAGVRVDVDAPAVVAGLAMAGVPLVGDVAAPVLGDEVAAAVAAPVDLTDPLAREEHSLVLRRAALDTFSTFAWRRAVGDLADVRVAGRGSVSVVLATRRPEMLDFALRQVARQRGVESLELVLAPHGFAPDPARVRDLLPASIALQIVPATAQTVFGDVLAAASDAASGDLVLKMDDDDWYAPDLVADLLRARAYSGAQLVGTQSELHYLAEPDLTVKRGYPSELYAVFVAGGTMLIERGLLREVGGFRSVRKFVDAQLLDAVLRSGAAVYRTHGLGYVLRRNATGHTWQADLDYLLDPAHVERTWPGFRPSRLLEADAADVP
ncbi:hypothetical protein [Nocardioides sp. cx-173]|uniref:hypothetical protein n=1 Tax=Nocardioides sp. cx-173 TaxID=2898796 RepID=UPI001E57F0D4|nr:hypothetical protein [Nocardioides sp. cx-173]MCD4523845.1 hypothetical protein [Nocardioides sp. cx-173]UGB41835.1 hypothetical protein LQ940_21110 [Nocardioides sp. cx-173]